MNTSSRSSPSWHVLLMIAHGVSASNHHAWVTSLSNVLVLAQLPVPVMHRVNVITTADDTPSVGVTVCPSLRAKAKVDWKQWRGLQSRIQHLLPQNRQLSPGLQLPRGAHFEELELPLWQQNGPSHYPKAELQHRDFQAKLSASHE